MNNQQRQDLIRFWHRAVYTENPSAGEKKADELYQRIESATAQVRELATTPLMVTIFCMVSYSHELPRLRAKLYEDAIAVLLTDTVHHEGDFYKGLEEWGGRDWEDRRDHLALIAFKMQERKVVQMPESDLVELIWKEFGTDPEPARRSAREFLRIVAQRGGLLEAVDDEYGFFTHATFQEYLAGRYLAEEIVDPQSQADFLAKHFADDQWQETIRLAAGYLSIGGKNKADVFVNALKELGRTPEESAKALALAGECLVDMRKRETKTVENISLQIKEAMIADPPQAPVHLRLRLGLALGELGDSRLNPLEPALCPIPAGPFRMGTSEADQKILKGQNARFYEWESPAHEVFVSEFSIGKYPVTNLEFGAFYDAKGYENPDFWSQDGWNWRTGKWDTDLSWLPEDKDLQKQYREWLEGRPVERRDQPFFWEDPQWNGRNFPVVGVSWFEAEAYANWLQVVTGKPYRLPTEAEWEKAARFSPLPQGEGQGEGRLWPWGNTWDGARCNNSDEETKEKLGRTSPVGMYPDGASPYGVQDMVGNVWEWCYDWYAGDTYQNRAGQEVRDPVGPESGVARVVRGGSWLNVRNGARCAYRDGDEPDFFNLNLGFRLVLSPG